ncbi:HSP20 family protein [Dioscorea alata]|uniref:HSP20 family protein n=1 Tax=Dioscorea alata TaxID=55571 RepID=A0ACB7U4V8_DIOAL|nr:HSP20 family protein [Dioscorea alata]
MAETLLLDSLLHLPEALEKIVFPPRARENHRGHSEAGTEIRIAAGDGGFGSTPVDILETPKAYSFFFDVPGVPKSDIQVTLEDEKVLVVKSNGKRKREEGEEEGSCKYLRLERKAVIKLMRKFRLPDDANPAAITAKCENGVLAVTVEKLRPPPESKPKTVEVAIA